MTAGRAVRSGSFDWGTPAGLVTAVHSMFGGPPALDPCSGPESIVGAARNYRPPQDGLALSWDFPTVYVNPPYGRDYRAGTTIRNWLLRCQQAYEQHGAQVLALVPVATNTRHWKEHVFGRASQVCFLADPRLRFRVGGTEDNKGAPMACAVVYWGDDPDRFDRLFAGHGAVLQAR